MVQLESYKRELAFIFFVQKKKILFVTLLMTVIAFAVSFLYPPVYVAHGSFLVKAKKITKDPEALEKTQLRPEAVEEQDLYSEMAILSSIEVMRKAAKTLQSNELSANFLSQFGATRDDRYIAMSKQFTARVVPDANVLDVKLQANSPQAAQTVLQTIMEEYIRYRTQLYDPESMMIYFNKKLNQYRNDADQKGREIRALVEAGGVTQASTQIEHNLELRADLMNSIMKLESDAVSERLEIQHLEKGLTKTDQVQFYTFIENQGILSLSSRFQELYQKQQDIQSRYLDNSEAGALSQSQVDKAYQALLDEINRLVEDKKTNLEIIMRKLNVLTEKVSKIEQENIDLRNNQIEINQLEKDLDVIRSSYDIFFQRSQESMAAGNPQEINLNSYISILTPAVVAPEPIFPKPKVLIPLGVLTGLILGLTLGFIYEFFDHRFKRPEEVEGILDLPVVLSITDIDK